VMCPRGVTTTGSLGGVEGLKQAVLAIGADRHDSRVTTGLGPSRPHSWSTVAPTSSGRMTRGHAQHGQGDTPRRKNPREAESARSTPDDANRPSLLA
jgi:hypothetical protein